MAVTIKNVAQRAGVSTATVSRVINHSPLVKPETREKVQGAIGELNYQLNVFAQGLSKNKANMIGVIVPPSPGVCSAYFFKEILRGVNTAANAASYNLLLNVDQSGALRNDYSSLFLQRQVDGLVIIAMPREALVNSGIMEKDMPLVLVNTPLKNVSFVDADNVSGGFEATRHLIKLGHRRVGFINGVPASSNARDRLKGYRQALKKYNIQFDENLAAVGDFSQEKGYEAMKKLLSIKNPPTAVFCANDLMAIGAIKAVSEKGRRVPEDVALVGFDDMDIADYIIPPLTTVRQPVFEMGKIAVESLIALINNKQPQKPIQKMLKVELIIRQSCGFQKRK